MDVKKNIRILVPLVLCCLYLILSNGCLVRSIYPFYTDEELHQIPNLKGKWLPQKQNCTHPVSNTSGKEWIVDDYTIRTVDKHGVPSTLKYKIFKIGNIFYIDTTLSNHAYKEMGKLGFIHVVPAHTICRIEIDKDCVAVRPMNYKWIAKKLKQGKISLPYIKIEGEVILTAPSKQLVDFLMKYGSTQELFPCETALFLSRQGG